MIYDLVRQISRIFLRVFYRLQVEGAHHIPQEGGVILISNHVSWIDPPAIAVGINRRVSFMAKEELFRNKVLSWFFSQLLAFPVQRGEGDRRALRTAFKILQEGGVLGLFPEGTRGKGSLRPFRRGAALIALKAGVPIIPVAIWGTHHHLGKGVARIKLGEPINVPIGERVVREQVDELIDQLEERVGDLLGQLQKREQLPFLDRNNKGNEDA